MAVPRLHLATTAVLVVDMQAKLLPVMSDAAGVSEQVGRLLDGANVLGLPVVVTEQYRKGLGPTVDSVSSRLAAGTLIEEKMKFSACIEPVRAALAEAGVRSVIVCGIEAHVCVLQTCLDLVAAGYVTAVAGDAIGSRRDADRRPAVLRMVQAGVLPTTVESALLELTHEAGTDRFKALLPLIK